jgi:hypothetical protein
MKRQLFVPLVGAVAFVLAAGAASADQSPGPAMERMQRWAADHEALLDAKLAGLKAGLKLNPDQEKLWGPFEAAVRDGVKLRMQHMARRFERGAPGAPDAQEGERPSPIDRLDALALRMAEGAAAIKNIADAGKPLYESLDDSQKRIFGWLGRELMMMGHGPHGMGMMRHPGMGSRMGMMGPGEMEMMQGGHSLTSHHDEDMDMDHGADGDHEDSDDE